MNLNQAGSNRNNKRFTLIAAFLLIATIIGVTVFAQTNRRSASNSPARNVLKGKDALGDFTTDAPGIRRHITVADLPAPYDSPSAQNFARPFPRPEGAMPNVPEGFKVELFATDLKNPRLLRVAPNGDLFIAESAPGQIRVIRDSKNTGQPEINEVFATGLQQPFGIAFYPNGPNPQYIYIGNTGSVVRIPYKNGDIKASGPAEMIVPDIPSGGRLAGGGHWTRDIAFSKDGKKMFVSVGSQSNVAERGMENEKNRADILEYNPDGTGFRIFASGIRNAVGITTHPTTGELWASVNERDGLGDHLAPDYITHVQDGGFYGWPWYYIGNHQDPRHKGAHPELASKLIVPDVLVQSHMASLQMTFYTAKQFPGEFLNDGFAAEHGSWNRSHRTGYKVIRVPMKNGKATGEYEDFMTGFVTPEGNVWGRPVGVAVASDGSLFVSDDGSNSVWRITYVGKR